MKGPLSFPKYPWSIGLQNLSQQYLWRCHILDREGVTAGKMCQENKDLFLIQTLEIKWSFLRAKVGKEGRKHHRR